MSEILRRRWMGLKRVMVAIAIVCLVWSVNASPASAYGLDYEMDLARVEKTIEFYGEELREVVEQAIRNNDAHPERKDTAQNTFRRQSLLNELLPIRRNSAFSKDVLMQLRKTEHPKDRLR